MTMFIYIVTVYIYTYMCVYILCVCIYSLLCARQYSRGFTDTNIFNLVIKAALEVDIIIFLSL